MTRPTITGAAFAALLGLALAGCHTRATEDGDAAGKAPPSPAPAFPGVPGTHVHSGFLYGRVTAVDGTYEGRLRWGGDQEAFWGDYFDGTKRTNPYAGYRPRESAARERTRIEIFGFRFGGGPNELQRQFLARFGDIARVDAHFADVQVTLKSGTVFVLDRFAAGDIDDGVRVWDGRRGMVDLDARQIRTIEFLPAPPLAGAPERLHGVVRTRQGEFTGFIQWNQQDSVSTDTLDGRTGAGETSLRYDTIRAIARQSRDSALVTLRDGREIVLSDGREVGRRHRGIYVEDLRYGRVLISWNVFEALDFSPAGGAGPAYGDFPPGRELAGTVVTRGGRRLDGRLVYDFDESETTETLDASFAGVDYAIPFGLIASIEPAGRDGRGAEPGTVTLHDGRQVSLERSGDLGERNAGLLIFAAGDERPEYVPWTDVARIDFDRAASTYPPLVVP